MGLIDDALRFHADTLESAAGETVTYIRGSQQTTGITAVRGKSQFEEFASEGEMRVQSKMTDWLIRVANLKLDGVAVEPERGDQIKTADGQVFEVFPGPDGEHWRWLEERQYTFRIHSVRRSVASE